MAVLSLGAITQSWRISDGQAVVLGHRDPERYRHNPNFLGVIAGRVANRIASARYRLGNEIITLPANDGANQLHGGASGIWACNWTLEPDSANSAIQLRYVSPDGESGHPGIAEIAVTMTLQGARLRYQMQVSVDRPTPIALAQHNYYHLGIPAPQTLVTLDAESYCPTDANGIPTGVCLPVADSIYDFRRPTPIGQKTHDAHLNLGTRAIAAEAQGAGIRLRLCTDQPGLQLYSGRFLTDGFDPWQGFCLEPQSVPNAVNSDLASVLATPECSYTQTTTIEIVPITTSLFNPDI